MIVDRSVSDGVGTSKDDCDGVVPSGAESEDSVIGDIDVDGASLKVGGGICNDCGDAGDQSVSDNGAGQSGKFSAFPGKIVYRVYPHSKLSMGAW